MTFKEVVRFVRKSLSYLAEVLDFLVDYVDEPIYLKLSFMIYKIISMIQKDVGKKSAYWEMLRISNTEDKWDSILINEINIIKPFGDIIKEALIKS